MSVRAIAERMSWWLHRRLQSALGLDVRHSQYLYAALLRRELSRTRAWLDLGCGHDLLPDWMEPDARKIELHGQFAAGIDLDRSALVRHGVLRRLVQGDIERLPFRSGSFDLVSANMVVEHVANPDRLFQDVSRLLAPGGRFLMHTPNLHGYTTVLTRAIPQWLRPRMASLLHNRDAADVYPTHYRANTAATIRSLARRSGLSVTLLAPVQTLPQCFIVPPLLVVELLLLRMLSLPRLGRFRACLMAVLEKDGGRSVARTDSESGQSAPDTQISARGD